LSVLLLFDMKIVFLSNLVRKSITNSRILLHSYVYLLLATCVSLLVGCNKNNSNIQGKPKTYLQPNEAVDAIAIKKKNYIHDAGKTLVIRKVQKDSSKEYKQLVKDYSNLRSIPYAKGFWNIYIGKDIQDDAANFSKKYNLLSESLKQGIEQNDTTLVLFALNDLSILYLYNGRMDSGLIYTKRGFDLAKYSHDNIFIQNFGNNLGYVYNQLGMPKAAQAYFEQSYQASIVQNIPAKMILNNLVSLLIDEGDISQAKSFWISAFNDYKFDPTQYQGQIFILQRVLIYQRENKFDSARIWLNKIKHPLPVANLQLQNHYVEIKQNGYEGKGNSDFILKHKQELIENSSFFCGKIGSNFKYEISKNPSLFSLEDLTLMQRNLDSNSYSYLNSLGVIEFLKGIKYRSERNENMAIQSFINSDNFIEEYENKRLAVSASDLSEKMRLSNLNAAVKANTRLLNEKKAEALQYQIISIALLIVAFLITLLIFRERKSYRLQRNIMQNQLAIEKKSAENLQIENEMNSRILTLSKFMVAKAERINKLLMQVSDNNYKEQLKEIRVEAMSIQSAFTDAKPQLADKLLENYQDIEQRFPLASELNLTEKRIFILSLNGYQSKEIASVLGLTAQYVNNSRTRIRKKLDLQDNWGEINLSLKNLG
jgi:DNA-binding CsgD family transcriptional regulator